MEKIIGGVLYELKEGVLCSECAASVENQNGSGELCHSLGEGCLEADILGWVEIGRARGNGEEEQPWLG